MKPRSLSVFLFFGALLPKGGTGQTLAKAGRPHVIRSAGPRALDGGLDGGRVLARLFARQVPVTVGVAGRRPLVASDLSACGACRPVCDGAAKRPNSSLDPIE